MLDDAGGAFEGVGGLFGGEAGLDELAVEDVVLAVGDVGLAILLDAQLGEEALVAEAALGGLPAEGDDLDRHSEDGAEGVDDLAGVDGDQHAAACHGDDLLAQECAAVALCEVELGLTGEVGERDAERLGLSVRLQRRGNADDAQAFADAAADLFDDQSGGGAGAEADGHAVLDLGGGPLGGAALGGFGGIGGWVWAHASP